MCQRRTGPAEYAQGVSRAQLLISANDGKIVFVEAKLRIFADRYAIDGLSSDCSL
jgi:hypothetical protein